MARAGVVVGFCCFLLLWSSAPSFTEAISVLLQNHRLRINEELHASDEFRVTLQRDCNLVLYKYSRPIWATNTGGLASSCEFVLQDDGNAVLYSLDSYNRPALFATNTYSMYNGAHYMIIQCDGNFVMYTEDGAPIWASNTGGLRLTIAPRPSNTTTPSIAEE